MTTPTPENQIGEAQLSAIQVEWLMTAISTELKAGYPARLAQRPTPRGSRWLAEMPCANGCGAWVESLLSDPTNPGAGLIPGICKGC